MTNEGRACGDGCPPPACHGASGQVAQPCACEPKAQQSPSHHAHQPVAFPCATVKDKTDGGQPGAGKKSSPSNSKLFIPSYLHEKEIMARMVAHDYGRQWLAERDAWHQLHATSDDHLRERMLERCRDTEARSCGKARRPVSSQIPGHRTDHVVQTRAACNVLPWPVKSCG
ncbi:uncharacterized protein LOC119110547 isoform X2 [Pollicipes pollicipes]|uniref:uncharacterized protein LOC119110547 isoform X2 n=1 Tax=Pollicipes pollicipes TaxID=41117 RepID=UPI001884A088|nr:uncharacterized protein LOC119110547 isoform X2 [Pollicipes pollicipes]